MWTSDNVCMTGCCCECRFTPLVSSQLYLGHLLVQPLNMYHVKTYRRMFHSLSFNAVQWNTVDTLSWRLWCDWFKTSECKWTVITSAPALSRLCWWWLSHVMHVGVHLTVLLCASAQPCYVCLKVLYITGTLVFIHLHFVPSPLVWDVKIWRTHLHMCVS